MRSSVADQPVGTPTLYAVIAAIADGPDLERVLRAVVDLLADATDCHACFIYLREGDRLTIRAASPVFADQIGRVSLQMGEGLVGWVARNRTPAFIREAALEDPRVRYFPELEEHRFQSMVAVPLVERHGDVIGVVVLHTEAPREFNDEILDMLVHVASLVAGAIDNARLYGETQRQVAVLSSLNSLSQQFASLTSRDDLYAAGCEGIRALLGAHTCRLATLDGREASVELASSHAHDHQALSAGSPTAARLTAELLEGTRPTGVITVAREAPFNADDASLLQTAANQLALALRTAERIEDLAKDGVVRQVFDALHRGTPKIAAARARTAGWDFNRTHVAVVATPATNSSGAQDLLDAEVQGRLNATAGRALIDIGDDQLRALIRLPATESSVAHAVTALRDQLATIGSELNVCFGISEPSRKVSCASTILSQAHDAARVTSALSPSGGAETYEGLGAYRFIVGLIGAQPPDERHADALAILAEYDERRRSTLLETLDAYLDARGAARLAADLLIIHPNTLRQRLGRIEHLTGLRLDQEDVLSLQMSLKLHQLRSSSLHMTSEPEPRRAQSRPH